MASDVGTIERLAERPMTVEPAAIEGEFTRLWAESSGGAYDDSSIRLRVLNFVALAHDAAAQARFDEVMQLLPQRHPCRGILALAAPEFSRLDASISAHCWRAPSGTRHVCSEEVVLTGPAQHERALASAVLALLVSELPVSVWLMGDGDLRSHMTSELLRAADGVFFDTSGVADVATAFRDVLHTAQDDDLEMCDLAWGRIATWRALCAQLFDGAALAQLSQITSIEISCTGPQLTSEALLLAGWLVSRLDLSLADVSADARRIAATLYSGTRGISVTLSASDGEPQSLNEVLIRTAQAQFTVEIHPESRHMHVREHWQDAEPVHRMVESLPADDATVIAVALDDHVDPVVYAESLQAALALLGA